MTERTSVEYTPRERFWLVVLATFGLVGVNGVFLFVALLRPGAMGATLRDPVAAAFVVEALVLTGVLAYLLARWNVSQVHWGWFVALSFLGSIAFALPVVLLVSCRRRRDGQRRGTGL